MVVTSALDDLQRKARLLENEIDAQLISLNKFNPSDGGLIIYFFNLISIL